MLCHRTSRGVVAYASQMLTSATPETSPSFANVEMGAYAAGETVHKIFRSAGEMIADGEGAFRAPYIGERSDALAGLTPGVMTLPHLLLKCVISTHISRQAVQTHLSVSTSTIREMTLLSALSTFHIWTATFPPIQLPVFIYLNW